MESNDTENTDQSIQIMNEKKDTLNFESNINDNNINISKEEQAIPASLALICGGCAGTSVDVCLFPIDTLKTRLQSPNGFWKSGGFRGIYKGLSAAAIGSAPGASLFFVSYEVCKPLVHRHLLHSESTNINSNPLTHMVSAGFGEVAACLVRVPTEIVKQRMQIGHYHRFIDAVNHIWFKYKLRGFYVGYGTTVLREVPFSFIQFPIWERLKLNVANYYYNGDTTKVLPIQGALCGSIAGSIAAAVTTPLDVVKTRLMLEFDPNGVKYNGFWDVCVKLYHNEGSLSFFKGITPRVSWIFVGGFFFFGAYEKSKQLLYPIWGYEH